MPNPEQIAQERREECRKDVLGFIAERQAVAHHAKTIRQRLNAGHEHDYTDAEIEAALAFLMGVRPDPFAKEVPDPMGATHYYQATSAGVIAHERI